MSGARYVIEHDTRYRHAGWVSVSQHLGCLTPRRLTRQSVETFELTIDPAPADRIERIDYFGNILTHFAILTPYQDLRVTARSLVAVNALPTPLAPDDSPAWDSGDADTGPLAIDDDQFRYASAFVQPSAELRNYARRSFSPRRPLLAAAIDVMHRIHEDFSFDAAATTVTTPLSRVWSERRGVCQDFAHLLIGCLRSLGIPARYVSGYLLTDPPPGQPRLIGADASHAWVSVRCPRHGWVDLDPTNGVVPDLRHVTLGWGRDYGDVSPLRGVVLGGGDHELTVGVSVLPAPAAEVRI